MVYARLSQKEMNHGDKPVPLIVRYKGTSGANVCMAVSKLFNCVEKQRSGFLRIFAT
jgi:hypothetical protein